VSDDINLEEVMKIDCPKVSEKIQEFIHMKMEENNHDGICLGISGGVDSSVAAAICVDALGDPSKVHGLHLYDRDSSDKVTKSAKD